MINNKIDNKNNINNKKQNEIFYKILKFFLQLHLCFLR